ncbi:Predicted dehydrogenase [Nonomuraea solani]|uniref:Predicted dehydrogenase n=1 Tax=Nonomuraea solani TaxID=1144553 RepID=A0A1H6CKS9_9ACTN|nr:Gfo/Idh/MocA family oxidoreductase [Nonomuraea solani]SEG73518.1 Predicted dehydrogenase [Nonomuraea solani]
MSEPVTVGLAGAGPWARRFHAPTFAAGPETRLAGVWSRRHAAAEELAGEYGVTAFRSYEDLLSACEGVVFAVPPDVQATLATRAAHAGRALLLEKPIALSVPEAAALTAAVEATGVPTQVVLTHRYRPVIRDFLDRLRDFPVIGARGCQLTGEFLDGTYADSPWRATAGVLYNTGPHGIDLLDAALGHIEEITGMGNKDGFLALTCRHESGAVSQLTICGRVPPGRRTHYEVYGPQGTLVLDFTKLPEDSAPTRANLRAEFAQAVRTGVPHPIDVHRGLHLQRLLAQAEIV